MRTGTIAFMIGIVAGQQSSQIPSTAWLLLFPITVLGLFWSKGWVKLVFALLLGFSWSFVSIVLFQHNQFPTELEGKELLVEGVISSIPKTSSRSTQFNFKTRLENKGYQFKLGWYEKLHQIPQAGERWRLLVKLKRPHGSMNPGGFDYERSLYRKAISATGYIRRNEVNQKLSNAIDSISLSQSVAKLRQLISSSLRKQLKDKPHQGLVEALAIGNRDRITSEEWKVLTATGTIHLVAISGLHIGLVAGFAFFLIRLFVSNSQFILRRVPAQIPAAIAAIFAALIYALLAGFSIPTQRAFIMVCVVMFSLIQRRSIRPSNVLAFSLLVILIFDPMSVLDIGFWLSFGAVATILFAATGRIKSASSIKSWGRIQFVIAIGMLPLMLLFFQRVSVVAPIANLLAVPWVSFVTVPVTLFATSLLDVAPSLSTWLLGIATDSLAILWYVLEKLAAQSWSVVDTSAPLAWTLIPASLGAFYLLMPRGMPAKWLALLLFLPALLITRQSPDVGELRMTLIDVGQGLSVLLQTKQHSLIFDTGPRYSSSFDAGEKIVLPFLKHHGINSLDALVVSHGDNDHSGGANAILNNISVKRIYSGANPQRWHNTEAMVCQAGQSWQWDNVRFEILHPQAEMTIGGNNQSCVLQVRVGKTVVLLPADIEQRAETKLIERYGEKLRSNVLVAPHHGSKTSSSQSFISTVSPDIILIANGYRNRYRFPHARVIKRYENKQISWLETQNSGAISLIVTPSGISQPTRWREKLRRYWHSQ